jgi:hypothetical protein
MLEPEDNTAEIEDAAPESEEITAPEVVAHSADEEDLAGDFCGVKGSL